MVPAIILSRPQMGENIGSVARVMSNFELVDLRIVNPRDGWPNPKAQELAANGSFILDNARIFGSINQATADLNLLYGTASLERFMVKPILKPKQAIQEANGCDKAKIGFLFGCERSGLTNDELTICDAVVKIPTSELNHSLNIAQAVAVICYEYFSYKFTSISENQYPRLADKHDIQNLFDYLEEALVAKDYFKSPKMKPTIMRNIKNLLVRAKLTEQDTRTLFGILKTLNK